MPGITIDRDQLVKEIDDLVACNTDAGAKATALTEATANRDTVRAQGVAIVDAANDQADAANAEAEAALTSATIDSQVADELLTKQVEHLKALVSGASDDTDPTPNA